MAWETTKTAVNDFFFLDSLILDLSKIKAKTKQLVFEVDFS